MKPSLRASVRWFLFTFLFVSALLNKASNSLTPDANTLAHELFGPTINALTVDAKISGPEGAISEFNSKDSDIKTGSKSGVAFKTGGSASTSAPGDDLLSKLIGQPTAEAATLTVQFRPTFPRKTVHLKITMASEENAERLQHGFDDVFAVSLDGKMIAFLRAADTKEPSDQEKAENPNAPRTVSLSEPITVSNAQLHLLKISIASVGDGNGPSTAIVSFEGEAEPQIHFPLLAGVPFTPPGPPGGPDQPGQPDPPNPPESPRKGFILHDTLPIFSAPPTPPEILQGGDPIPVPDRSSSLIALLFGCLCLAFLRRRVSPVACPRATSYPR